MPLYFRHLVLSTSSILFLFFIANSYAIADSVTRFGIWVEAEGVTPVYDSQESVQRALLFLKEGKFTDIYCQVYRGGRSWYPSIAADDTPFRLIRTQGYDPLREFLAFGRENNVRVHAWVNIFNLAQNRDAPLIQAIGRKAVLGDTAGNSLLDYDSSGSPPGSWAGVYSLDSPALWLDPSEPQVRSWLLATIDDLITAYPELNGIHLDMARYPFLRRDRGANVNGAFRQLALREGDRDRQYPATIRESRREQVTSLVLEMRALLREKAPHMTLSAAVLAPYEKALLAAHQPWGEWLDRGYLDRALPMVYQRVDSEAARISRQAVSLAVDGRVDIGLGAWLKLSDPSGLEQQIRSALAAGAAGVVLFSYSNLANERGRELVRRARQAVLN